MKKLIAGVFFLIISAAPHMDLTADPSPSPAATAQPYLMRYIPKCPDANDAIDSYNQLADFHDSARASSAALALSRVAIRVFECAKRQSDDPRYAYESDEEESSLGFLVAADLWLQAMTIADQYKNCALRDDLFKSFRVDADLLSAMQLSDSVAANLGKARDSAEDLRAKPCP